MDFLPILAHSTTTALHVAAPGITILEEVSRTQPIAEERIRRLEKKLEEQAKELKERERRFEQEKVVLITKWQAKFDGLLKDLPGVIEAAQSNVQSKKKERGMSITTQDRRVKGRSERP